jgi:NTP pyrophosphatase (non-canonical NTP hydrolase)
MSSARKDISACEDLTAWQDAGKNPRYRPRTLEQKLGYLVEECGEVIAAVGKTQRWGPDALNPEAPKEANDAWLLSELADLELAIGIAKRALEERQK